MKGVGRGKGDRYRERRAKIERRERGEERKMEIDKERWKEGEASVLPLHF